MMPVERGEREGRREREGREEREREGREEGEREERGGREGRREIGGVSNTENKYHSFASLCSVLLRLTTTCKAKR